MQKDIRPCYGEELQKLIALNKKFDSGNVFGASQFQATAGTVERAQFSLKFVKNNLPPAISEDRMNVLILLYIHKI